MKAWKRPFDIVAATVLLILTSPIWLIITILSAAINRGDIFFTQQRIGLANKPFKILKFKTMRDDKDSRDNLLPDAERTTRLGRFLRSSSLDEIPQIINVLRGDMSLIGPRPLLPEYLPFYSETQARRHEVRPGITGWAQCHGRNAITWGEKFHLDVWYIDNYTFLLDCKILWLTFLKVLKREGINQEGNATVQPFNGKN
ncbi:MAG: sugar transferase [Paramuribaculum sp.]|nr:sugar transferase [Paramuribaculum sp.]